MPSIQEIIAAKKAAAAATAAPPATRETVAEQAELKAAIDRIDPPGKSERRAAAKGIVLTKEEPTPALVATRKIDEQRRSLSETEGEGLPLEPLHADTCIKDWHKAMTAFETELVIMNDPLDPERAWLAVRLDEDPMHPLLLKALPFYEHPRTKRTDNAPF